jgi:hypothetical protein
MTNNRYIRLSPQDKCCVIKNYTFKEGCRIAVKVLPLAGILVCSFLPLSTIGRQCLMLALLVWVQVYFIFDIFFNR